MDPLLLRCFLWWQPAEHLVESLTKGARRVIVTGRLVQRTFETQAGEKRTVIEMQVDEIGPSLRYSTAEIVKTTRTTLAASAGGSSCRTETGLRGPGSTVSAA